MKIFDVIRYDNEKDRKVFAWRWNNKELGHASTLQVSQGQQAVLFSNGQLVATYGAGKHRIDGNNVQLLNSIKKLFTGGVATDTNYIWFINDYEIPPIFWGTNGRQSVNIHTGHEGRTMTALVGSRGYFTLKIVDLEKFVINYMVSQPDTITMELLQKRFSQQCMASITDGINSVFIDGKIPFDQISARKNELAAILKPILNTSFDKLGIEVTDFIIDDISLDNETLKKISDRQNLRENKYEEGKSEEDYSIGRTIASRNYSDARAYSQKKEGYNYQEKRKYDVLQKAAENEGAGSSIMNAGIGLSAGLGMGNTIGEMFNQKINKTSSQDKSSQEAVIESTKRYCGNCGEQINAKDNFCSACGNRLGG